MKINNKDNGIAGGLNHLQLAMDILAGLIPDEGTREQIKALAETHAKNWCHLGIDGQRHILAAKIIEAVEKQTGEIICFARPDEEGRFTNWFVAEKKHQCGNVGIHGLTNAQNNALIGPERRVGNRSNKLPARQGGLVKE